MSNIEKILPVYIKKAKESTFNEGLKHRVIVIKRFKTKVYVPTIFYKPICNI